MITPPQTNKRFLGSVRTVHTERADLFWDAGDLVEGLRRPIESIYFNSIGNVIEVVVFDQGILSTKSIYSYDEGGKLIESASYKADGSTISKTIYMYEDEHLTGHLRYNDAGSVVEKGNHTYDVNGKAAKVLIYDASDTLMRKWTFNFDPEGERIDSKYDYDQNQNIKASAVAIYDVGGRLVELTCHDSSGRPVSKTLSIYDSAGNNIEQSLHNEIGALICKSVFAYDVVGHLTKRVEDYISNGTREEYSYSYEFDDVGNWIKKIIWRVVPEPPHVPYPGVIIYQSLTYQ